LSSSTTSKGLSRWRTSRGQSLVEFAIAFPLLLLLVIGGSDLARAYFVGIEISDAARESAMYIARTGPYNTQSSYAAILPPTGTCTGSTCSSYPAIFIGEQAFAGSLLSCPPAATTWTFSPAPGTFTLGTSGGYSSDSFQVSVSVTCALSMMIPGPASTVDIKANSNAYVVQP
jgi:Flp pilus assembly protein TadG